MLKWLPLLLDFAINGFPPNLIRRTHTYAHGQGGLLSIQIEWDQCVPGTILMALTCMHRRLDFSFFVSFSVNLPGNSDDDDDQKRCCRREKGKFSEGKGKSQGTDRSR